MFAKFSLSSANFRGILVVDFAIIANYQPACFEMHFIIFVSSSLQSFQKDGMRIAGLDIMNSLPQIN